MAPFIRKFVCGFLPLALLSPAGRAWAAAAVPLNITIDPAAARSAISPYIYGSNQDLPGAPLTVRRSGGNRLTGYNWENNASNAGSDYIHSSDNYLTRISGIPGSQENIPGIAVTTFHDASLAAGVPYSVVSLQLAGYVARDKIGAVVAGETAPSNRWLSVGLAKGSALSTTPDSGDGFVYMDEFVNFLVNRYGHASTANGVKGYNLDNEPDLWSGTHPRIHPAKPTCVELIARNVAAARAVKRVDPTAEILGFVSYGFNGYFSFQDAPDWATEKSKGSYRWFVDYYLDQMQQASNTAGTRLLDVIDLHNYSELVAGGERVNATTNWANLACNQGRMQAPRSYWDPTYVENSWIGQYFARFLPFLPNLKASIDTFYPGTKLALTEYNFGGESHISGGIAQADTLGIFGAQGVYLAAFWQLHQNPTYIASAFKLYRNYDGANGKFGDTHVAATNSDAVNSSVYASINGTDLSQVHVIVLNKSYDSTATVNITIGGSVHYASARVWAFDGVSENLTERAPVTAITGNAFSYSLPLLTAAHFVLQAAAAAPEIDPIRLDQFGYLPDARKIAVLADPQNGFDAAASYNPGTTLQVRRQRDDGVVFTGAPIPWNGGATHADSGDKCWWFDFSALTAPGRYYVYDVANNRRSPVFEITAAVYRAAAVQAARMFFLQRSGFAKQPPFVNARWADGAAFLRANQDPGCRLIATPGNAGSARDLRGGWFDAGDYNKYTTFTREALQDLLLAYEDHPAVWGDDHAIPESGNGIPDLLDEVKWELDWLVRMQQSDGSLLSKVGVAAGAPVQSPASSDDAPRYYGAASTRSTITGADIFAHAAIVFKSLGRADTDAYAAQLGDAAVRAWDWAAANPAVSFSNAGFDSADPDGKQNGAYTDADDIAVSRCRAAAKLFALTGDSRYRTFFDANYEKAHLLAWSFAYLFETGVQDGLLYYLRAADGTASVQSNLRTAYANALRTGADNLPAYSSATDPYQAFLPAQNYTWGSNSNKARQGNMLVTMERYGLDTANAANYRHAAAGYLHYLHGVNPLALVYLSNMGAFGAERSVTEFYHSWFGDGTVWDSTVSSAKGPPPGFLTGGPNPTYAPDSSYGGPRLTPPLDQPAMKSYRDWNTSWPQNSWEVTEPGIYYQAAYVRLLAAFLDPRAPTDATLINLSARATVGSDEAAVFPGFAISGSATARVLVRAVGPTLLDYNVSPVAADPRLTLFTQATNPPTPIAANDDWTAFPDQGALEQARVAAGAFPLRAASKDAALLVTLAPGLYSAKTENASGASGVALVEVYDVDPANGVQRRAINLSCRAVVGSGDQVVIPGVFVQGSEFVTLLIRAVGPGLSPYGVRNVLVDPMITLYAGATPIATNDNWQDASDFPLIKAAADQVQAFALSDGSTDAAMLVRVPPGSYTVVAAGAGNHPPGVALIEIYQVNPPSS